MHRLAARVRRTIRRFDLMPAGSRVAVALSGGADSVALVHLLAELQGAGGWDLAGIVHLNHGLRPGAAEEDEAFCARMAMRLGLPFDCERTDVAALASAGGLSIESAGHEARYAFFQRATARLGADCVALGHTRDDQVETLLLRLFRGAGPRGLAGMHPRHGLVVRPLLGCSRAQVRRYVEERGLDYREDATNLDVRVPRNLVRHEILPALTAVYPRLVRILDRTATIAREDADALDALAAAALDEVTETREGGLDLDCARLLAQPPAIASRVVFRALRANNCGRFVSFGDVRAVLALARPGTATGAVRHLAGQWAERYGGAVRLRRGSHQPHVAFEQPGTNSFRLSLSIPGEVVSPLGWAVTAERRDLDEAIRQSVDSGSVLPDLAVLDASGLPSAFTVRGWRQGDRIRPLGLEGTKKLQDIFVDRKVPQSARSAVPVVVDDQDRVIWVAGHVVAGDFRVTAVTRDVVILKLKYWRNGT